MRRSPRSAIQRQEKKETAPKSKNNGTAHLLISDGVEERDRGRNDGMLRTIFSLRLMTVN